MYLGVSIVYEYINYKNRWLNITQYIRSDSWSTGDKYWATRGGSCSRNFNLTIAYKFSYNAKMFNICEFYMAASA